MKTKVKVKVLKTRLDMTIAPALKLKLERLAARRSMTMGAVVEALIRAEKVYIK